MRDVLDILVAHAHVDIEVTVDPDRLRPADLPALVGDPGRADAELGWHAELPLDRTLADLLDWWRARGATA